MVVIIETVLNMPYVSVRKNGWEVSELAYTAIVTAIPERARIAA